MPLGARLTQNDFKRNFWNGFWHEIETRIYTHQLKRLKQFSKIKMSLIHGMTKIPFSMDFANNNEIRCRERCNWSETISNDLKCKKRRIELVFLGPKLGYNTTLLKT